MSIPPLSRRGNAFLERNLFLHAVLGVRVFGERFSTYVQHVAREAEPAAPAGLATPPREVLLLLGLLSLWRRCERQLDAWSISGAKSMVGPSTAAPARHRPDLGELFR